MLAFAQYLVPLALLELYFHVKARPAVAPRVTMAAVRLVVTGALVVGIAAAWMALWRPHIA